MSQFFRVVLLCTLLIACFVLLREEENLFPTECDLEFDRLVDAVYVLNLERCKDRLSYITSVLNRKRIKFERFPAIDGSTLRCINLSNGKDMNIKEISKHTPEINPIRCMAICDALKPPYNTCKIDTGWHSAQPGEIGCAMSHIAMWNKVASSNHRGMLVLEDDAVLFPDFKEHVVKLLKNLPKDADIVFLGFQIFGSRDSYVTPGHILSRIKEGQNNELFIRLLPFDKIYGTYAYYITKKGAKKLANIKSEYHIPIDTAMICVYRKVHNCNINVYASKKKIVYVNFGFDTTVRCE